MNTVGRLVIVVGRSGNTVEFSDDFRVSLVCGPNTFVFDDILFFPDWSASYFRKRSDPSYVVLSFVYYFFFFVHSVSVIVRRTR